MARGEIDWSRVRAEAFERFGVRRFRRGQRELLEAALSGRDALGRGIARVLDRSRDVVEQALRRGEAAARQARQRLGRGLERAGREVRPGAR